MTEFFKRTQTLALFIAGFGTSLGGLYTLAPQWALAQLNQLPYMVSDTIFIQHWGFLVLMMGCSFFIAIFRHDWVVPIFWVALIEKLFFVSLVIGHSSQSFIDGFWLSMVMDSTICLYIAGYLWTQRNPKH
ncbi:hypothetical protein [Shewanella ulleungensis]|uniref:DUF4345 domain-containing protein n=1 Tax=Shewanella ulleungensis TaxID=2282699 RepID=A0ABQ2QGV7_9GAMM|nr:hypothetical protein [Shewanella ulleungensis]MCL1149772.1 hypothetical protein [Shewanella ulleungensis]GGP81293.1 hypothetical protein GCM10009410_12760 [Shewanella ulleungensis]